MILLAIDGVVGAPGRAGHALEEPEQRLAGRHVTRRRLVLGDDRHRVESRSRKGDGMRSSASSIRASKASRRSLLAWIAQVDRPTEMRSRCRRSRIALGPILLGDLVAAQGDPELGSALGTRAAQIRAAHRSRQLSRDEQADSAAGGLGLRPGDR